MTIYDKMVTIYDKNLFIFSLHLSLISFLFINFKALCTLSKGIYVLFIWIAIIVVSWRSPISLQELHSLRRLSNAFWELFLPYLLVQDKGEINSEELLRSYSVIHSHACTRTYCSFFWLTSTTSVCIYTVSMCKTEENN